MAPRPHVPGSGALAVVVMFGGQVMVNGVPVTVTVNVHDAELLAASVAVQVTVVVPNENAEPDAGEQTTDAWEHASVAVGVAYSTVGLQTPTGGLTTMFAGQVIAGAVVSLTVTVNVHEPVLPAASVAVHVTVVVPSGKPEPTAGVHMTVALPHGSVAVGTT